jgi:poly(beta-D-mannuronate) lyase
MMKMNRLLMALIACVIASPAMSMAAEHQVSSAKEIDKAARAARPGDVLVMKDGTWTDQKIKFAAKGTKDQPITLRAATPGKVIVNGKSTLAIGGEHLVVSGLAFNELGDGDDDVINIKGTENRVTIAPSSPMTAAGSGCTSTRPA